MSQVTRKDDLGNLQDFGSFLRLTGARVTVGGRQYKIDQLDGSYPSLVEGTTYTVYVTAVSQTPAMVISTTAPGTAYAKVGAFLYKNGAVNFSTRIPKVTEPTVSAIEFATGSAGTTTENKLVWRQVGEYLEGEIYYQHTAGGSAGSGDLQIVLPNNYQIDTTKVVIFDEVPSRPQDSKFVLGTGIYSPTTGNSSESGMHVVAYSTTTLGFVQQIWSLDDITVLAANVTGNASLTLSATFRVPILDFAGDAAYEEVTVPVDGIPINTGSTGGTGSTEEVEGGINYISNGDFNTDLTGWSATAGTLTRETAAPIEGTASLKFISSGSAATIDGDIDAIPSIDQSNLLGVLGTVDVVDASGSYATGDFTAEVYDTTNAATVSGPIDLHVGRNRLDVQGLSLAAQDSTTYKLRFKDVSANSTDYLIGDRFKVTPDGATVGHGGWKEYDENDVSLTGVAGTIDTYNLKLTPYKDLSGNWRLSGNINVTFTSATQNPVFLVDGILIKTTGIPGNEFYAIYAADGAVSETARGFVNTNTGGSANRFQGLDGNVSQTHWSWGTFDIPLEGKPTWADWDGSVMFGTEAQAQNTRFKSGRSTDQTMTPNDTWIDILWNDEQFNTGGGLSYDSGTGLFTVNAAGIYRCLGAISATGAGFAYQIIRITDGAGTPLALNGTGTATVDSDLEFAVGDTFKFQGRVNASSGNKIIGDSANSYCSVSRWPDKSSHATGFPFADQNPGEYGMVKNYRGTWTPAYDSDLNLTGTPTFNNATYEVIGNKVFVEIDSITGLTTTSINTNTTLVFTSAGLPGVTNSTIFGGTATWYWATGVRYRVAGIFQNSGSDNKIFMGVDSANSGSAVGATTIYGVRFSYTMT